MATAGAAGRQRRARSLSADWNGRKERLLPTVRSLAAQAGAELALRRVETPEEAEAQRFLGSPTVRVNGVDVDPGAAERGDYGMKCRIYRHDGRQSPVPPERWIRAALRDAANAATS
jgi:hypothetical protein